MKKMRIGLIREGKSPPDTRVALTPKQCKDLLTEYRNLEIYIQPSKHRSISSSEYIKYGVRVREEINNCDVLMGIKEIPSSQLTNNKTYIFFSHTIKMQTYNKELLKQILMKKVELIDYECFTDENGDRLVGFGNWAGIVGAHNALWAWGRRHGTYTIERALNLRNYREVFEQYENVKFPAIKIAVTGRGRVGGGVVEVMEEAGIKKISVEDYINKEFDEAVYVQLGSAELYKHKDTGAFDKEDFYANPQDYINNFERFIPHTDMMIHATYWDQRTDKLFTKPRMIEDDFKMKVIADITCDVNGAVSSTVQSTSFNKPVYGYDPKNDIIVEAFKDEYIDILAINDLPCELARDASNSFGNELMEHVMEPLLKNKEYSPLIEKARIAIDGELTERYSYLQDFVNT
jgi:saccharopine dehydrogenase (NAD+, L-lysine forming)